MATSKVKKIAAVEEVEQQLRQCNAAVLTDFKGLKVSEATELRTKLRAEGISFKVVKNTLIQRAASQVGLHELYPYLEGPTAIAFSKTDPVVPAKLLLEYGRVHKALVLKAGILEGKVISAEQVRSLAELPPREVLLSMLLGTFQAPITGMARVLQGPLNKLVYVLEAVRQQKEGQ